MSQFSVPQEFGGAKAALRKEFSEELFLAGEATSSLLFDSPWHSECRFVARELAKDFIVANFLTEAEQVFRSQGMDAARQVIGWDKDVFSKHALHVANAIRPQLVTVGGWRAPVNEL